MSNSEFDDKYDVNNLPVFTFSLPIYNGAEFLDRCLKSIFSQDYPSEKIEVMLADGGSTDSSLEIAKKYNVTLIQNTKRLADYGAKLNVEHSKGDLLIIFAADNELENKNWLQKVAQIFLENKDLACLWCNMISSKNDPKINRYYELIKSDPLMFSINKNLNWYLSHNMEKKSGDISYTMFKTIKNRSLVWGANGLVYRISFVKHIILQEDFVADNDVFQIMLEEGHNNIAYSTDLKLYHHHLKNFNHWISKWKRNYQKHLLPKLRTRNMNWLFVKNFRIKVALWFVYSLIPIFSSLHTLFLIIKDKNIYWVYHPIATFCQAVFLLKMTLGSKQGREFLTDFGSSE